MEGDIMNNIKAAFFDFDWTLFDHKTHSFIESAIKSINQIQAKGIKIFINSARSYYSLQSLKTFDIFNFDGFVVSNGGAAFTKNKILYAHYLNKPTAKKIIDICKENQISYLISTLKTSYIEVFEDKSNVEKFYNVFYEGYPLPIEDYNQEDIIAIQIFSESSKDDLFKDIKDAKPNRFFEYCLEFTSKEFVKSEGIEVIISEIGYKVDEICAFGDDLNDIDMFKLVKYGICMGNGNPIAKTHAFHVTTNIDEDGILNALKFLQIL